MIYLFIYLSYIKYFQYLFETVLCQNEQNPLHTGTVVTLVDGGANVIAGSTHGHDTRTVDVMNTKHQYL